MACILFALIFHYVTFADFATPDTTHIRGADAAVVFIGAHGRIDAGLRLRGTRQIPRLFISGFNPEAGITPNFVGTFARRKPDLNNLATFDVGVAAQNSKRPVNYAARES